MQNKPRIKFHCPKCDQLLRTDHDLAGTETKCPSCSVTLTVPDAMSGIRPSDKYAHLTDAQLEKRLADVSGSQERDAMLEELTKRFADYYIKLLDEGSKSNGYINRLKKLMKKVLSCFSVVRTFSAKLIGYLSKEL